MRTRNRRRRRSIDTIEPILGGGGGRAGGRERGGVRNVAGLRIRMTPKVRVRIRMTPKVRVTVMARVIV